MIPPEPLFPIAQGASGFASSHRWSSCGCISECDLCGTSSISEEAARQCPNQVVTITPGDVAFAATIFRRMSPGERAAMKELLQ